MNISFFKKGLASVALTGMLSVLFVSTASANLGFTDASEIPSWAEEAIQELMDQGVLNGNDDGSFAPNRQLNRAEVAKIIVMASGVDFDTYGGPHFPDVDENAWYYDYVETMYNYGWIDGYPDGMFRPANGINRAEIAKMSINAFEIEPDMAGAPHFDDVMSSDWFYSYVETAYNNGLMRGFSDGTFGPAKAVTRAETARIVYDSQLAVSGPVGPAEGTLEVMLSEDTPRGTNVPYNATSVPYTTIELTASDDSDVEISSLTFTRLGLGDNDDFDSAWLEIDGFKVGNDKSINNDDIVELRFNPPVVVPAGQTLVADVVTSAKYTSTDKNIGHHNRIALVAADDIASTAQNIVGDFPIEGEEMQVADYEVSTVTFTKLGSDTTIDVGDNFIEIGKFRMENSSNTNKDVELRAITFKNTGTAEIENVLENVALYVSGEQVSAETIMDGDYITFRLDNGVTGGYVIEDGDSRIFSMRADIVSAEKSDSINFKIDNYEDVVAIEIGTSFGVKAVTSTGANAEDANATLATYTIDSGDLNVSRDPSSLGNQQYAPGSNDVVMLTARLVVDQPLLVDGVNLRGVEAKDSFAVDLTLAQVNSYYDNFRLFLNDKLVDSENDFVDSGRGAGDPTDFELQYNTTFEIAGASVMKLVANITNTAVDGSTLKVQLLASDFASPEYISTGDSVASTGLLGSANGSFVEVTESVLVATVTDGLSAETIVAGVDDITMMEFTLDNNDSGDVNVTSVTVDASTSGGSTLSGTNPYSNYTVAVFVDGTQQGSSKNLSAGGVATFNDLSVVIPSAMQKEFVLVANTLESSSLDVIQFQVTTVDADNVENGSPLAAPTGVPLTGAAFTLVASGDLTASVGSTVYSDILVAGASNVELLKIRFNASNDDIEIKDVWLKNNIAAQDFGARADFKLYNEAGQLIQSKTMTSGALHFELANQDRIRVAKDGSTTVTVKADIRDITRANQTGKQVQLALDAAAGTASGLEAVTAATGSDLAAGSIAGTVVGEPFVAYRTQASVKHAAVQPNFSNPSALSQEVYRFTVTADAAHSAEIAQVSLDVALSGMVALDAAGDGAATTTLATFDIKQVKSDGTIDNTAVIGSVAGNISEGLTTGSAVVTFTNQRLAAGESRTFALFLDNTDNDVAAQSDDDAVSVTIVNTDTVAAPAAKTTVVTAPSDIVWSDESDSAHSATTLDWLNGYLVEVDTTANVNAD